MTKDTASGNIRLGCKSLPRNNTLSLFLPFVSDEEKKSFITLRPEKSWLRHKVIIKRIFPLFSLDERAEIRTPDLLIIQPLT